MKERLANFTYLARRYIKTFPLQLETLRDNLQLIGATFLQRLCDNSRKRETTCNKPATPDATFLRQLATFRDNLR